MIKTDFKGCLTAVAGLCLLTASCVSDPGEVAVKSAADAPIFPDYRDVTVPANIAPLNFRVREDEKVRDVEKVRAVFFADGKEELRVVDGDGLIEIPEKKWHEMLDAAKGKSLEVEVSLWSAKYPDGISYKKFPIHISADLIDPYISYRLIEPGYEIWDRMGIYQRNLRNFEEKAIADNYVNHGECMNCHSYKSYSPDTMMFHARGKHGGTVIYENGKLRKVNLAGKGPKKQGVYPMWHPGGRYIIFSSNETKQAMYGPNGCPIEVFDFYSDMILYDVAKDSVIVDPRFIGKDRWETFPAWSPDGRWLYYCAADSCRMPYDREKLHYDIMRVGFDPASGRFSERIDTVRSAAREGGSASFPRISPDGRFLMYTRSDFATFPIWHDEADLRIIRLADGKELDASKLNSDLCESYHSWSSSGRWVVFSSRRLDGRYTRLFIAHIDADGNPSKPFLLPQKDSEQNRLRLKSYNIPELMKREVKLPEDELKKLFQ